MIYSRDSRYIRYIVDNQVFNPQHYPLQIFESRYVIDNKRLNPLH